MGEVAEAEGGSAEVFQSAVDGFGRSVAGSGAVEVGQDVSWASTEGGSEASQFGQWLGDAGGESVDDRVQGGLAAAAVGVAVGGDESLVDAPGGQDLDVVVGGEQCLEALPLLVGEQVRAGQ